MVITHSLDNAHTGGGIGLVFVTIPPSVIMSVYYFTSRCISKRLGTLSPIITTEHLYLLHLTLPFLIALVKYFSGE